LSTGGGPGKRRRPANFRLLLQCAARRGIVRTAGCAGGTWERNRSRARFKYSRQKAGGNLRLYLDNCTFNRPFDDQKQLKIKLETEAKLFIQQGILDSKYELVWSYILEYENSQNKFHDRRNAIYDWKDIAKIHCAENDKIIEYAEILKAKKHKNERCPAYCMRRLYRLRLFDNNRQTIIQFKIKRHKNN
jgi:hypothetical protein